MPSNRRRFLQLLSATALLRGRMKSRTGFDLIEIERPRVLRLAGQYLKQQPVTVTAAHSQRSAGGLHDYFSEGDYWWPDPKNPGGPYIQRDGQSNPDNFVRHRQALIRLSQQMPALASACILNRQRQYADKAAEHLRAWFVDPATRMNPNLQFAQAVQGRTTGRSTGIIDTLQLVDVVRAIPAIEKSGALSPSEISSIRDWFKAYLHWMNTSKNGREERDTKNNHATCWMLQAAVFASYVSDKEMADFCRNQWKSVLLPNQMAADGSFPLELRRTKPYSYSLFNLEVMAGLCQILSRREDQLWSYALADGRSMRRAMDFAYPYISDKKHWPYPADVMYFDQWPLRQQSLLFAGLALGRPDYLSLWSRLNEDPTSEEAIRNYPMRQPLLWVNGEIAGDPAIDGTR